MEVNKAGTVSYVDQNGMTRVAKAFSPDLPQEVADFVLANSAVMEERQREYEQAIPPDGLLEGALESQITAVRNEAQRRIVELFGADDLIDCLIKQSNTLARATELTQVKFRAGLDTEQQAEAAALQAKFDQVKAIRSASNVIEGDDPIPAGEALRNDPRWPA